MAQLKSSRDARKFYKQTFEVRDNGKIKYRHTLLVNPQEMSVDEPHRASVTQTLGGAYVELFGKGLHTVNISGLTGYHARKNVEGKITDGYQEMRNFRNKIYRDFLKSIDSKYQLFWYNWEDTEYYQVIPMNFRLQRSRSEPTMYRYDLSMTCIKAVGAGTKPKSSNLLSAVNALGKAVSLGVTASKMGEVKAMLAGGK